MRAVTRRARTIPWSDIPGVMRPPTLHLRLSPGPGIAEIFLGVDAEGQSLEDIAAPITAQAPDTEEATER